MELYVIETIMPDGPHWYGGIRSVEHEKAVVRGPEWSPYWEDRKEFNYQQAEITFTSICASMPGCEIIPVWKALKRDAWVFIPGTDNSAPSWAIRAKYMSKNMIVNLPGRTGTFRVMDRGEKTFRLVRCNANGDLQDCTNDILIGVNSKAVVTVVGERREVAL